MKPYFIEIYQSPSIHFKQSWRWRMKAPNGRIVADGCEGYSSKSHARRAAMKVISMPIEIRVEGEPTIPTQEASK